MLGLGTWTLNDETAARSVYEAVRLGYRLIDTARYYGNERGVGNGIRKAVADGLASREELFVTTKIMPGDYRQPDRAIDESLGALGTGYIDFAQERYAPSAFLTITRRRILSASFA